MYVCERDIVREREGERWRGGWGEKELLIIAMTAKKAR